MPYSPVDTMRDQLDALLAAAVDKIEQARAGDPDVELLPLAADDLNRAAALAGAIRYVQATTRYPAFHEHEDV